MNDRNSITKYRDASTSITRCQDCILPPTFLIDGSELKEIETLANLRQVSSSTNPGSIIIRESPKADLTDNSSPECRTKKIRCESEGSKSTESKSNSSTKEYIKHKSDIGESKGTCTGVDQELQSKRSNGLECNQQSSQEHNVVREDTKDFYRVYSPELVLDQNIVNSSDRMSRPFSDTTSSYCIAYCLDCKAFVKYIFK